MRCLCPFDRKRFLAMEKNHGLVLGLIQLLSVREKYCKIGQNLESCQNLWAVTPMCEIIAETVTLPAHWERIWAASAYFYTSFTFLWAASGCNCRRQLLSILQNLPIFLKVKFDDRNGGIQKRQHWSCVYGIQNKYWLNEKLKYPNEFQRNKTTFW